MTTVQTIIRALRLTVMLGAVGALATVSGCVGLFAPDVAVSHSGDNQAPRVFTGASDDSDAAVGMRENPRIIASYGGVYRDHDAELLIAGIVSRLLAASDQSTQNYTITILDTADVNAFALPGGYIYVTRGILALANDSSEIAAVLAHEMGHIILHHARARTQKLKNTEMVDNVMTSVFGKNAATEQITENSKRSFAAFSQAQELAADKEGIMIIGKAGFDPFAAARFLGAMGRFQTFSAGDATQADDFLSSHPSTPDRIRRATEEAQDFFGKSGRGETSRSDYLASINGMNFGPSEAQGAIVGQRFIQPGLKITFTVPQGYKLQISQGAVVAVAGDGEAVRFDSAQVPPSMGLADYLKSGWIAGLDPASVTSQQINGIDTASGVAKTDQWSFRVSVMRADGDVYRFIFAAKADTPGFTQGADQTLQSFRRTTPHDIAMIRHAVVKVVTARPGDTADTLARRMSDFSRGSQLFYVLNDLYPGDPVTPGEKYKIISVE